jgi:hypothetical protein
MNRCMKSLYWIFKTLSDNIGDLNTMNDLDYFTLYLNGHKRITERNDIYFNKI